MSKLRTVAHLKSYLDSHRLSPEGFAARVKISNMTIRRMLKKTPATRLPEKYLAAFDAATLAVEGAPPPGDFGLPSDFTGLLADLEKSGAEYENVPALEGEVAEKLNDKGVGDALKDKVLWLLRQAMDASKPAKNRAIAIGGLLYFINPFDLIPDATPVVGYLDDFAVLSLSVSAILALNRSRT